MTTPRFGLIIVGDEILSGKRQDEHLPRSSSCSARAAWRLAWARYVGDDRELITEALRHAFASGDVVFCCGGIGATPDDHTRQCAAAALGRELALHPQAKALIQRAHARRRAPRRACPSSPTAPDNVHRLNMGVFPAGAADHPQPVQQDPRLLGRRRALRARLSGDGAPDDRVRCSTAATARCTAAQRAAERSVIVFGAMEAALTPLMEAIEREHAGRAGLQPAQRRPPAARAATSSSASRARLPTCAAGLRARCAPDWLRWAPRSAPNWCGKTATEFGSCIERLVLGLAERSSGPPGDAPGAGMLSATFACAFVLTPTQPLKAR